MEPCILLWQSLSQGDKETTICFIVPITFFNLRLGFYEGEVKLILFIDRMNYFHAFYSPRSVTVRG
jgi:hypothetical protein